MAGNEKFQQFIFTHSYFKLFFVVGGGEKPLQVLQLCNAQNDVPYVAEEDTLTPTAQNALTDLLGSQI